MLGAKGPRGPCPPMGKHRYFFNLCALDTLFADIQKATKVEVDLASKGHVVAIAQLVGTYERSATGVVYDL